LLQFNIIIVLKAEKKGIFQPLFPVNVTLEVKIFVTQLLSAVIAGNCCVHALFVAATDGFDWS
jgi:hypothetical protein